MAQDHFEEILIIEMSRAQREAMDLPADTGEMYDECGVVILSSLTA